MKWKDKIELFSDEKILFYSPYKDRWENYRLDLIAYIIFGFFSLPIIYMLISFFDFFGIINLSDEEIYKCIDVYISVFVFLMYMSVVILYIRALKVYKQNYPFVLTNKRIILEKDFLKKKKPIGTFIEGAEKVAYIEVTRRVAYVYFKKDGEIKKVPLSYLSKYREDFKKALKELFGDRYVEKILWKEGVPLNKKLIEEIFSNNSGKTLKWKEVTKYDKNKK